MLTLGPGGEGDHAGVVAGVLGLGAEEGDILALRNLLEEGLESAVVGDAAGQPETPVAAATGEV